MTGINLRGLNITGTIVPTNAADTFATHDSFYGLGGWREVETLAERDAIPAERRRRGMVVFVRETLTNYQLLNAESNGGWAPLALGDTADASAIINEALEKGEINLDLTGYAKVSDLDVLTQEFLTNDELKENLELAEADIKEWVEAQGYLTEHQSLADYVTRAELDERLTFYPLRSEVEDLIENNLEEYATKGEVVDALSGYVTADALAEQLKEYAKASDIPGGALSLEEAEQLFATKEELEALPKQEDLAGYLTVQDLQGYATEAYVQDFITDNTLTVKDLQGYATEAYVDDKIADNMPDVSIYATKADVKKAVDNAGYLTETDLRGYATRAYVQDAIADLTFEGVTEEALDAYVKKNELINALEDYATEDFVKEYVANNAVTEEALDGVLTAKDLKGYATEAYVQDMIANLELGDQEDIDVSVFATKAYVDNAIADIEHPTVDLDGYATEEFVVKSLKGYATEAYVQDKIADGLATIEIPEVNVDLTPYATKEDLEKAIANIEFPEVDLTPYITIKDLQGYATMAYVEDKIADALTDIDVKPSDIDLTGYAKEEYVDEKVAEVNERIDSIELHGVDLTGYATEEFVNNAIEAIEHPTIDLTPYVTKKELEKAIEDVEAKEVDLTGYATEAYVDDAVANVKVDLTGYATEAYVDDAVANVTVDLAGYATEAYVDDKIAGVDEKLTAYAKVEDVQTATDAINTEITNIKDGLTAYAKVEDVQATTDAINNEIAEFKTTLTGFAKVEDVQATTDAINNEIAEVKEIYAKTEYVDAQISETKDEIQAIAETVNTEVTRINEAIAERPTLTEVVDLIDNIDYSDFVTEEELATEMTNVVKYQNFTYNGQERKTIQLANHDTISGISTTGEGHNLVMLSKWDVADFGAAGVHLNLNTVDTVTINDNKVVATISDVDTKIAKAIAELSVTPEINLDGYVTEEELAEALAGIDHSTYATRDELETAINSIDLTPYATKEELNNAVNAIDLTPYATKEEVAEAKEDVETALNDLASKAVVWLDFVWNDEARKAIQLANHDVISGVATDGTGHNLIMLSKYNVVDMGSPRLHANINTAQIVTVNDTQAVATDALLERLIIAGDNIEIEKVEQTDEATGFKFNAYKVSVSGDYISKEEHENKVAEYDKQIQDLWAEINRMKSIINGDSFLILGDDVE